MPLEPGPKRTRTYWPGRSSVMPKRRSVSMCTKMSGVPSPQVREAEAAQPVEPFDLGPLQPAGRASP